MSLCNRVQPDGAIVADTTRGLFMGNRGRLHGADGSIRKPWQTRRWICCVTEFRNRRVPIMQDRGYTALFFLDEATSLAAGHRPCAECRWGDFNRFLNVWQAVHGPPNGRLYVDAMDRALHEQRFARTTIVKPDRLADGAMVSSSNNEFWLYWQGDFRRWTPNGYAHKGDRPSGKLTLLTPAATLATLRTGYRPIVHPSAKV